MAKMRPWKEIIGEFEAVEEEAKPKRRVGFQPVTALPKTLHNGAPRPDPTKWDAHPRFYFVNGKKTEFFTIGALAIALNRSEQTLRLWERNGILPKTRKRTRKPVTDTYPDTGDPKQVGVRLYTREQIVGMVEAAEKEGILYNRVPMKDMVRFKERIAPLFKTKE